MEPVFFESEQEFRLWLERNHQTAAELSVGFYKKNTGKPSMSWSQSVDQALCFGWIDGVRNTINEEAYRIRFTPRRTASIWSAINIDKMEKLLAANLVYPMGKAAYDKRTENKSRIYAYEKTVTDNLPPHWENEFKSDEAAWEFFVAYPPGLKHRILHWITSAKQETTRRQRFEKLMDASKLFKRL